MSVTGGEYGLNYGYWTMSAYSSSSSQAIYVNDTGDVRTGEAIAWTIGARAVVVVNK